MKCWSRAIVLESFCPWAEAWYRELAHQQGQPLVDVALRRVEHPVPSGDVLRAVCEQYLEVATELGLSDGSGVSRALSQPRGRLAIDGALRRRLRECRERLVFTH